MGKSTIYIYKDWAIFNSYVNVYQRVLGYTWWLDIAPYLPCWIHRSSKPLTIPISFRMFSPPSIFLRQVEIQETHFS